MPLISGLQSDEQAVLEVHARMQQWRRAHPRATLREIEQEVDRQMAPVRTRLIAQVAHQEQAATRPDCPSCGEPMQRVGTRERTVLTAQDATLTLRGAGYRCPACGAGLFPPR
jgi:YgiT-type zinc finger domain-containing protein